MGGEREVPAAQRPKQRDDEGKAIHDKVDDVGEHHADRDQEAVEEVIEVVGTGLIA
jgi:hypothetical protein